MWYQLELGKLASDFNLLALSLYAIIGMLGACNSYVHPIAGIFSGTAAEAIQIGDLLPAINRGTVMCNQALTVPSHQVLHEIEVLGFRA